MSGPYGQTYTGKKFHYFDPSLEEIGIVDIAHALGNQCRFQGHCDRFYSVAEHCYHASYMVSEGYELEALLHDASEAYIGDVPGPLKSGLSEIIKPLEKEILQLILEKYDAKSLPFDESVKDVDIELLYWERRSLMGDPDHDWAIFNGRDFPEERQPDLQFWTPDEAKTHYLKRFDELT